MKKYGKFLPLYSTNLFGVMNDNVLRALVSFIAATWVSKEYSAWVVNAAGGALVVPYLLFSPLAGKLPHYFKKQQIIKVAKIFELPIMLLAILGFSTENLTLTFISVILMGLQSALFSPSKYGLIKDIGCKDGISQGMGGMEAFAFIGLLLGTVVGSIMKDHSEPIYQYSVLIALAIAGIACSFTIKVEENKSNEETSANPIKFIRQTSAMIKKYTGMPQVILLLSLYWWLTASIQSTLLSLPHNNDFGISPTETGVLFAILAIGIAIGCLIGGRLDRKTYMLGYIPQIGLFLGFLLLLIFIFSKQQVIFTTLLAITAVTCGIFKIPLDAEIQKKAKPEELNIILAYFNLISFIFIFLAAITNIAISTFLPVSYTFLVDGIIIAVGTIIFMFNYKEVLCYFSKNHIKLHYDIQQKGLENMETKEGENLLILPMHRAVLDPIMLFSILYNKKLQPLVDDGYWKIPVISHILNMFNAVKVPNLQKSRKGVEQVQHLDGIIEEQINKGANILFYPSGHITLDGKETIGGRRLAYNASKILPDHTKVIGIKIKGFWGSKWSKYKQKKTPSIVKLLLLSILYTYSGLIFFKKKRKIDIEYVDITKEVKEWSSLTKLEFNKNLEDFYNEGKECEDLVLTTF